MAGSRPQLRAGGKCAGGVALLLSPSYSGREATDSSPQGGFKLPGLLPLLPAILTGAAAIALVVRRGRRISAPK